MNHDADVFERFKSLVATGCFVAVVGEVASLSYVRRAEEIADEVVPYKSQLEFIQMENPYTPPAYESARNLSVSLYSPGHVAWATFLGAPIAGCVLAALNYRRLGNFTAANLTLVAGLVGTTFLMAISFVLPDRFPSSILPIAYTFGMYQCVKSLQGSDYEGHLANGGDKASAWVATGVGILSIVCIFILLFAFVLIAPDAWFSDEL